MAENEAPHGRYRIEVARGNELSPAQLYALLRLRVDVFVVEQECAYPELDGADLLATTEHVWAVAEPGVLGCLRVLGDTEPWRIGRVCTRPDARGRGIAASLLDQALRLLGHAETVLSAQTRAIGLYERFGFVAEGRPYDEDGIEHVTMRRRLER
ncbi:GNAT family N-acetyltransferase [Haloechinothrix sp. LS1_15]|uniref:GNAT family N-acetyltransferase n=1 Tax=Haloechinothrix sp. LS1_15 TaxID=2652248 RepID=UPI00294B5EED|nr:GNAT family N-acetyltransferase [Haloechinothrix sp. LS1_15]